MELLEIDETTEDTYYRCLHDEIPADPRVIAMRRECRAATTISGEEYAEDIDCGNCNQER